MSFDINFVVSAVFLLVAYVGYLYVSASDNQGKVLSNDKGE